VTAVVTGAGGALGAAVARRIAAPGTRLVLVDVDGAAAERTAGLVRDQCATVRVVDADVSDEHHVRRYVAAALEAGDGRIDQFFNNAGVEGPQRLMVDYPTDAFDRVVAVNLRGVFLGMKHVAPHMPAGASIVNTASTGGLVGNSHAIAYIATKHAVVGMSRSAAKELAGAGIRVNAYCPGPIEGRMLESIAAGMGHPGGAAAIAEQIVPMGRLGHPDEHAETVAFLLSGRSSYTTGTAVVVDGGRLL
jgi:NAD(P)-dependent dehydrogenase (short-subunit alcohol dehydrogenase family)